MSNTKAKAELTLVQDPAEAEVAALFESLTGRKPTGAEMRQVRQTLAQPQQGKAR
jgi:hypothetical protein